MSTTAGTVGTALVTGATHGIGRAAALRLARDGSGIALDSKLPNSAGVEASAVGVRRTYRDCRGDGPVPAGAAPFGAPSDRKHLERGGFANPGDRGPAQGCVRGRHLAGHALHVPTPVRQCFLIGPEHTDSTQQ